MSLKKEITLFFTALMFFTRIPCPAWIRYHPDYLRQSAKYFSLVGIIVGGAGALVFYMLQLFFPKEIALLLSMATTVYITGAFHEDGFADVCDGFGGGWNKENILRIMKDSRLGTYGVVGIGFVLAIKFYTLRYLPVSLLPISIICGHALSRGVATTLLYTHPYVRDTKDSKAKPAAENVSLAIVIFGVFFGVLPLLLFQSYWFILTIIPVYASKVYLGNIFKKWIGGQTGDCAGAVQQFGELIFYLSVYILWKFI